MGRDQIVLITGTSSGFGLHSAVTLAQEGYQVVATMRNLERKKDLFDAAQQAGVSERIHLFQLDLLDSVSIEETVERIISQFHRVDVLINNAGISLMGAVEEIPLESWRKQFETNLFGVVALTQAIIPHMRRSGGGKIINIGSGLGIMSFPLMGAYASSKFALEGLSEALRFELKKWKIDVVLIEPGTHTTNISSNLGFYVGEDSSYQSTARTFKKFFIERAEKSARDPRKVALLIKRILQKSNPKFRYQAGIDVKGIQFLKHVLPWKWTENIVNRVFR